MTDTPIEYTKVELPLVEQLKGLGWEHIEGDIDVPYLTERESFRDVLLLERLREAVRRINLHEGEPWLDNRRVNQAIGALERLGAHKLMEANQIATELLLKGTAVEGDPELHGGKNQTVRFIDFQHPDRNDLLVINQIRVDPLGGQTFIIPNIVLFVNGIPLVVIECKSPAATEPMEEGITQLLRYCNRPDGGLLLFAGLYESWQREPSEWEPTFTIVTTEANATLESVHNRMPVILPMTW